MKKMILAVLIIVIFLGAGKVNAEGAWVLWEHSKKTKTSDTKAVVTEYDNWEIIGAYPSYNSCIVVENKLCKRRAELWGEVKGKVNSYESWGGHTVSVELDDGFLVIDLKCLPESVDPRK